MDIAISPDISLELIENCKASQFEIRDALRDPCTTGKKELIDQYLAIEKKLIHEFNKPYYCCRCRYRHYKGKKYLSHKQFAQIKFDFPPISYPAVSETFNSTIVGIYYTGNGSYVQRLPGKTKLELKPEPNNVHDNTAVSVWHAGHKLGYIPRSENEDIFNTLQQNVQVECRLGHYRTSRTTYQDHFSRRSSRRRRYRYNYGDDDNDEDDYDDYWDIVSDFRPERADITINIDDHKKIIAVINGVCELIELGLRDIGEGFENLGIEAIRILESHEQFALHPSYKQILSTLYRKYQIPVKADNDLNIIL